MMRHALFTVLLMCLLLLLGGQDAAVALQQPSELYRVAFVTSDDTLNVRSGAGVNFAIVGELPYNATDITITGAGRTVGRGLWVPVRWQNLRGWVNRYYLVRQIDSATFCADPAPLALVEQLRTTVALRDGQTLETFTDPVRGLLLRRHWWNNEIRLLPSEIETFFTAPTLYDWGIGAGNGFPINGTVAEIMLPLLDQDLLPGVTITCNELVGGNTAGLLELPPEYQALNFYSVHRPAPASQTMDWGTWVIGFDYWGETPVITYLVHYQWEI